MEQKNYTAHYEVITPQRAKEILENNPLNRKARPFGVKLLVDQIKRNEWNPSPSQALAFASDGTLIDGQHRLIACIQAGKDLPMYVVYNVPKSCKTTIDTGVIRNGGDVLCMEGIPNGGRIASIIKIRLALKNVGYTSTGAKFALVSNKDYVEEYTKAPELYQELQRQADRIYSKGRYLYPKLIGGVSAFLILEKKHSADDVSRFFSELAYGGAYDCIGYLRRRLALSASATNRANRLSENEKLVLVSKAWNLFIAGKDKSIFHCRKTDFILFI